MTSRSASSGRPRTLFAWTVEVRAGSGAGAIASHLLEPQCARLEAIAVVLRARTENSPNRVVARHRRARFTVNDGRRPSEQRGDHDGSFHATHDSTGNSVRARQSRVTKPGVPEDCTAVAGGDPSRRIASTGWRMTPEPVIPARALLGASWPCAGLLVQSAPAQLSAAESLGRPPGHDRFPPPRTHQQTPSRAAADRRERQSIGAFLPQRDQQVITIAD